MKDKLTASEAVYGLLGWLTTRDTIVAFGSTVEASTAAELADQFCKENDLEEPRDGWEYNLIHPSGECSGIAK